jgi:hypothetical protein
LRAWCTLQFGDRQLRRFLLAIAYVLDLRGAVRSHACHFAGEITRVFYLATVERGDDISSLQAALRSWTVGLRRGD